MYADTAASGGGDFNANGRYDDPVYAGQIDVTQGDLWPGQYSRTHVGSDGFSYGAVMDGIRAGRIWVDHGQLISGLDVRALRRRPLGHPRRRPARPQGPRVTLSMDVALAGGYTGPGSPRKLARVDVIQGDVTGTVADQDTSSPRRRPGWSSRTR